MEQYRLYRRGNLPLGRSSGDRAFAARYAGPALPELALRRTSHLSAYSGGRGSPGRPHRGALSQPDLHDRRDSPVVERHVEAIWLPGGILRRGAVRRARPYAVSRGAGHIRRHGAAPDSGVRVVRRRRPRSWRLDPAARGPRRGTGAGECHQVCDGLVRSSGGRPRRTGYLPAARLEACARPGWRPRGRRHRPRRDPAGSRRTPLRSGRHVHDAGAGRRGDHPCSCSRTHGSGRAPSAPWPG